MTENADTQNKKIQKNKSCLLLLASCFLPSKKGQVAVILILVVAAALIFYAISLNLGRISQTKVITTVAADTAASTMASYMASYGQSLFVTQLGRDRHNCGWTGIVAAILAVIVAIIAVATSQYYLLALVSLILAVGALIIQLVVIQPGLTDAWNAILWHSMEMRDAFVEQGVQRALSGAATDSKLVPDLDDSDGDRVWGLDGAAQPLDKVSRFGFYYRQMRINTIPLSAAASVADFSNALDDFLYKSADEWGIFDDTGPKCAPFTDNSECNPCCIHPDYWTEEMGCAANSFVCADPEGCAYEYYIPNAAEKAAMQQICEDNSPYGVDYPWVYDAYRENPLNNVNPLDPGFFISFRERLGRDDEHRDFRKNPVDDPLTPVYDGPNGIQASMPGDGFRLQDTTGFYTPLVYPANDNRTGVFSFFYKIADWGMDLRDSDPTVLNPLTDPAYCYWHDDTYEPSPLCAGVPLPQELASAKMVNFPLPVDPATLQQNTTWYVDGNNDAINPGEPPLWVDQVRLPDLTDIIWSLGYNGGVNDAIISPCPGCPPLIGVIEATPEPQCAQNSRDDPGSGFWKRGGDRFCSGGGGAWPYYGECSKYNYASCEGGCPCALANIGSAVPENWPDDLMDDLVYGLNNFIEWATNFLGGNVTTWGKEFTKWYPEAAGLIERGTEPEPVGGGASQNGPVYCYVCEEGDGALWVWYKDIQEIRERLQAWRDTSFAGSQCREVWCVPPAETPPYNSCSSPPWFSLPSPAEEATFDNNDTTGDGVPDGPNGIRGDIEDVTNCINWNANDSITISDTEGTVTATGNAQKFRECYTACQNVATGIDGGANVTVQAQRAMTLCSNLPRSLVPNFDTRPSSFISPTPPTNPINKGSCGDAGFMSNLQQSDLEAQNQVAKFLQRYNFLRGRLTELDNLLAVLGEAQDKFYQFLTCDDGLDIGDDPDGAACRLIKARIEEDEKEKGLPYQAIYAWQDEPEKEQPDDSGKWHIVRADARIPEKCDRACNTNQSPTGDPPWPYVKSDTESWGTRRCYDLKGTTGVVKARVTRFDETGKFSTLLFPNAVEIWKPTFGRGDRPLSADPDDIEGACRSSMVPNPGDDDAYPGSYYYGAFILNKRLNMERDPACLANCSWVYGSCKTVCSGNPLCETACQTNYDSCELGCRFVSNVDCWDLVNQLLASGVTSEACAQYYFHEGTPEGMDFKFVPCRVLSGALTGQTSF